MSEVAERGDWDHYRGDAGNAHPQLSTCKHHMFEFRVCAVAVNVWAHIYLYIYLYKIYVLGQCSH